MGRGCLFAHAIVRGEKIRFDGRIRSSRDLWKGGNELSNEALMGLYHAAGKKKCVFNLEDFFLLSLVGFRLVLCILCSLFFTFKKKFYF